MSLTQIHGAMLRRHVLWLLAATAALLATAPLLRAQSASSSANVRVRCATCASKDSARVRRLLLKFDSLRYAFENERLSEAERERLANEMHRTVMQIQESLDEGSMRSGAVVAASSAELEATRMAPPPGMAVTIQRRYRTRGYLGVSFDGPSTEEIRNDGERIIRFLAYPRIALVEPSSPAERAGIEEGDTLLSFNGNDVREKEISLTKLLVPSQRIAVRVRRDGNAKDFQVRVTAAPGYVISRMEPMVPMVPMAPMAPMPPMAATGHMYPGQELPSKMAMPPMGPTPVGWPTEGIGGARLETITEGLGKALGTKSGVLVLRAAPGTPAYESGLRDGDIILRAEGKDVGTVRDLRFQLQQSDGEGGGVKLVIVRERKQKEVTLRW